MNVKGVTTLNCGKLLQIVLIVYQLQLLVSILIINFFFFLLLTKYFIFFSWWKNFLLSWGIKSRSPINGTNQTYYETYRCTRSRFTLWFTLVWSRQSEYFYNFFNILLLSIFFFYFRIQWDGERMIVVLVLHLELR